MLQTPKIISLLFVFFANCFGAILFDTIKYFSIANAVDTVLNSCEIFTDVTMHSSRQVVKTGDEGFRTETASGVTYSIDRPIGYNEFLKRIASVTNIPITELHTAICKYAKANGGIDKTAIPDGD